MAKVLVVDDAEDNIELLRFDLEDDGFEVISANSGLKCLELIPDHWPDIVLLDIQMPGIDGQETLKRIKQNTLTADVPVIMVSAQTTHESVIHSLDMGAHDFVHKPIEYPILAARMRSALHLVEAQQKLERANKKLEQLATRDSLTGINNRRNFFKLADAEFSKVKRYERPMSIMMLDGDEFKLINDKYGHAAGDEALLNIVRAIISESRESDVYGRIGGEEFAICCPDTDAKGAAVLAERIRVNCENHKIPSPKGDFVCTVSIGIAPVSPTDADVQLALGKADHMLYEAKRNGRNQVASTS